MTKPGNNETKGKIAPSNSWLIISVDAKILNLTLQPEHHMKSVPETQAWWTHELQDHHSYVHPTMI